MSPLAWRDIREALTPTRRLFGAAILAALVSLSLHATLPIAAEGYLMHDDALFVRLAQNISNGEWLGPFDDLTLAKGPFYPLFIAAAHALGLPLLLAQDLAWLAAAAVAAYALARITASRTLAVALFAALALDPTFMHPVVTHVIREGLYSTLGLALVALAALAVFDAGTRLSWRRVAVLVAFGLVFAAYWLTREESVWLYPSLAVIAAGGLAQWLLARRAGKTAVASARALALSLSAQIAIAFGGFAVLAGSVVALNYAYYGVAFSNEFREGSFASGYGALQRLETGTWTPYLMFDADVAAKAYAVSPAARELKAGFEGANGAMWREIGCRALTLDPCPNAYARGWFMWALRDATQLAGHYKSASEAQAFFARLAAEINAACDAGRIACGARRDVMAPPFSADYLPRWTSSFFDALAISAYLRPVAVGVLPSKGRPDQVAAFAETVGPVALLAPLALTGWVASRICVPHPHVVDTGNRTILAGASYEEAKDIEAHFAKAGAAVPATRFRLETDCREASCVLAFDGCTPIASQPLAALEAPGWLTGTGEVLVRLEDIESSRPDAPAAPGGLAAGVMFAIAELYGFLVPLLLAAGVAGTVAAGIAYRKLAQNIPLAALTVAAGGAILARATLIAAFEVSSAYSVNVLYLAPAAPFVLLFGFAGARWAWLALTPSSPDFVG